jgi:hypothetical protein
MVTFGPFLAFIRLWVECMIVRPCSQAIVALTFSTYILKPFFPDCLPPDESIRLLAAVCICKYTKFRVSSPILLPHSNSPSFPLRKRPKFGEGSGTNGKE